MVYELGLWAAWREVCRLGDGRFFLKSHGDDATGERAMAVHEEALLTGYGKS